ncbi:MAG: phosphoribosyl-AMP cyclohydrolase [Ferrimicrobium sp.]
MTTQEMPSRFGPLSDLPEGVALRFAPDGLLPAVVVDEAGTVLMVAYVDEEALRRTRASGRTWFYSRSRKEYWAKGETSGSIQEVVDIYADCDLDTVLIRVRQHGTGACHTGSYSCFEMEIAHATDKESQ